MFIFSFLPRLHSPNTLITKVDSCFLKTDETTRNARGLPLWLATLNFGKFFREAVIRWCDETVESLKTIDAK